MIGTKNTTMFSLVDHLKEDDHDEKSSSKKASGSVKNASQKRKKANEDDEHDPGTQRGAIEAL